jgi:hypothetical protein
VSEEVNVMIGAWIGGIGTLLLFVFIGVKCVEVEIEARRLERGLNELRNRNLRGGE